VYIRLSWVILFSCLLQTQTSAAPFEMDVSETDDLRLLYLDPFQTHLLPHIIRTYYNSLKSQRDRFDWEPYEKPTILLSDFTDYGNASASVSPYNLVLIDIAPMSRTLENTSSSERFFMYMNHELVHIATMDASNQQDRKWRRFFGGKVMRTDSHPETILFSYLTTPRDSTPRWYAEGSAVFVETWLASGIGRAQGAYDEMVFRAMVRDKAHFYSNLGLVSEGTAVDFQVGANAYLYGTRFMGYLASHYSPQHVIDWLKRGEDSKRYYSKQFSHIFGKRLEDAWSDWIAFEKEFQQANLESVRQQPLTATRPLSRQAMGSVSRAFFDSESNQLVGAFRMPGVVAHVGSLSLIDGKVEHLTDIKGPMLYRVTSSAWDPQNKTFFYTTDNFAYRDLMAVDVRSGKVSTLIEDARVGDLVFDKTDQSLLGLRHMNGYVSLVRIPYPYTEWNQVYTWPQGRVAYELDVSPDGELISVSVGEINGDQFLRVFRLADLQSGVEDSITQFNFSPAVPEGFVFSPDGKYLFGSSYITGVSNIFRYEIASGEIEAVSNAETGFFRPIPMADGSLMVFEYTGQGFLPTMIDPVPLEDVSAITFLGTEIVKKNPVLKDWSVVTTLGEIDNEEIITRQGKYRPNRELGYGSGYPIIEGYRDSVALGWAMNFHDPLQLNKLSLSTSYSLDNSVESNERLHFNAEYRALNWHARYWHNDADFYDLFGPTKRGRKGDTLMVGYEKALILDEPRQLDFSADVAYYTGLDTLPGNQNVSTLLFDDILHGQVEFNYTNTRKSLGAVDHEKGIRWDVVATTDHANSETIPKLRAGLDFGFALPWKHSSVWFYNAAGASDGNRLNTLSNYYFGGYGNNYVDDGEVKRYRKFYSMPGFEIDAISAHQFVKSVAEWNLPPIRFRSVGTPGFYLSWVRPAVFVAGLVTDPGKRFEQTFTSAGFQLDLHFTLGHRHTMTLSAGYAAGFNSGDKIDDELMISLKVL